MREAYPRLFEPAVLDGRPNPLHLDRAAYLELGRAAARATAARNGAGAATSRSRTPRRSRPSASAWRCASASRSSAGARGGPRGVVASATAELSPLGPGGLPAGGGYDGPLELRQGKPMRPDVAQAFDRMERAARADGVALLITSAYRSDAEQAVLWRRHPDPRWVARPGESLHRYGDRARPRPACGVRLARGARRRVPLRAALRARAAGISATRSTPARRRAAAPASAARRAGGRAGAAAELRPRSLRARARPRGAALERLRGAARRAALCREQLQPVRRQPGGRPGHRAVHARDGARDGPRGSVRRRRRRSTPRRG